MLLITGLRNAVITIAVTIVCVSDVSPGQVPTSETQREKISEFWRWVLKLCTGGRLLLFTGVLLWSFLPVYSYNHSIRLLSFTCVRLTSSCYFFCLCADDIRLLFFTCVLVDINRLLYFLSLHWWYHAVIFYLCIGDMLLFSACVFVISGCYF